MVTMDLVTMDQPLNDLVPKPSLLSLVFVGLALAKAEISQFS